jgi:hypothetical protein
VGGHGNSWADGAGAGGGRSSPPSAGVGPYLDPASRCGVSSQVEGLIVRLLASEAKVRGAGGSVQSVGSRVVGELAEKVARGCQLRERAAVA